MDTAAKRFSVSMFAMPFRGVAAFPAGSISQAMRQAVAWLYAGILFGEASEPEPPVVAAATREDPFMYFAWGGPIVRR